VSGLTITILETINSPGKGTGTGDDRYGFDEGAGAAWVFDGATDVSGLRLFDGYESDAAWIAETLSRHLSLNAPQAGQSAEDYFASVLESLRETAAKQSKIPLDTVPPEALPISSGMWMRVRGGRAEFAWLGDCMALIEAPSGAVEVVGSEEKSDRETEVNRKMASMSPEEKLGELRRIRAIQNTVDEHAIFGLNPAASGNLNVASRAVSAGSRIILMTDGLWRLVDPYATHTPETLAGLISEAGLSGAIEALRSHEASDGRDLTTRHKAADDACAVLVELA
jgi:serine/threonine protein phosphatase PrpC